MKSKFSLKNITKFVLILVSSAYIAYTNAGDFFNFPTLGNWETSGVWFASLIFIGMIFWHFMDLQTTISNYENTQPNIVVDMSLCTTLEDVVYDWRGQGKNRKPKYITKRYFLPLKQEISKTE